MKQTLWMSALLAAMTGVAYAGDAAPAATKSLDELTAPCAACHGATGVSSTGAFPTIAGQHPSYLEKSLLDYKSGERKNPIMAGQVANLSENDIKRLAAFFARQEGPLYTPALD